MTGNDSIIQLGKQCPLCKHALHNNTDYDEDRRIYWISCPVCHTYGITYEVVYIDALPSDTMPLLSAVVRRRVDLTGKREVITPTNFRELASQVPDKQDVPGKVRYLLGYITHKSNFPGEKVTITSSLDYPVCFAANTEEFDFYMRYAVEAGFVEKHATNMRTQQEYSLTTKGWEETRHVPTLDSPNAFVAMSFSKEGRWGASLSGAFEDAIRPAIEDDAGYQKAIRIDRQDFLGDIVFEIIARIKECRFIVADVTEHRNGVYFEAGYAMGMGLPVIWTCHKDDMKGAHFDTNHMNHIVWDDIGELRTRLSNRILATIGQGPRRRPSTN